jgi:hypothetical protein
LEYFPGESYSGICALADLSVIVKCTHRISSAVANLVMT